MTHALVISNYIEVLARSGLAHHPHHHSHKPIRCVYFSVPCSFALHAIVTNKIRDKIKSLAWRNLHLSWSLGHTISRFTTPTMACHLRATLTIPSSLWVAQYNPFESPLSLKLGLFLHPSKSHALHNINHAIQFVNCTTFGSLITHPFCSQTR